MEKTFTTIMLHVCFRCGVNGSITATGANKMSCCHTGPQPNVRWAVPQCHCEMRVFLSPRHKVSVTVTALIVHTLVWRSFELVTAWGERVQQYAT